jgi:ABC-type maltose transport system permease subunit
VGVIGAVVRIYSYIFHLLLSVFLLGLSLMAFTSGYSLRLEMFPWDAEQPRYWLLALGIIGIAAVLLALKGVARVVFLVWAIAVFVMLAKGYVFSGYRFAGVNQFTQTLLLLAGALLACVGAWLQFRRSPRAVRARR